MPNGEIDQPSVTTRTSPVGREGSRSLFDGFKAVNDLSFYVDKNELRVIIGPNGAGKTTVLDLICGKTKATSGHDQVSRQGADARLKEKRSCRLGRRPQVPDPVGLRGPHRVREPRDVVSARPHRVRLAVPARRREVVDRVAEVAEMIFLKDRLGTGRPLSHGQKQWLEIGMLLIQDPELLMLDEPVAGMSVRERDKTAELLNRIIKDRSVLVIEHDMNFVEDIAHKVTVLHQGQILSEGTMEKVQNDPKVIEVYLGSRLKGRRIRCSRSCSRIAYAAQSEVLHGLKRRRSRRAPTRSWRSWAATAWARPR